MSEAEIAKRVADLWLVDRAVYSEVPVRLDGTEYVIDLVALANDHLAICECKKTLTDDLMEQAQRWTLDCNELWIAVEQPRDKSAKHARLMAECMLSGVGVYYVQEGGCTTKIIPEARGGRTKLIEDALDRKQQMQPSGIPSPKRRRPDKWGKVRGILRIAYPDGYTAKELAREFAWSQKERTEFLRLMKRGEIEGIRAEGSPQKFYAEKRK